MFTLVVGWLVGGGWLAGLHTGGRMAGWWWLSGRSSHWRLDGWPVVDGLLRLTLEVGFLFGRVFVVLVLT